MGRGVYCLPIVTGKTNMAPCFDFCVYNHAYLGLLSCPLSPLIQLSITPIAVVRLWLLPVASYGAWQVLACA